MFNLILPYGKVELFNSFTAWGHERRAKYFLRKNALCTYKMHVIDCHADPSLQEVEFCYYVYSIKYQTQRCDEQKERGYCAHP